MPEPLCVAEHEDNSRYNMLIHQYSELHLAQQMLAMGMISRESFESIVSKFDE